MRPAYKKRNTSEGNNNRNISYTYIVFADELHTQTNAVPTRLLFSIRHQRHCVPDDADETIFFINLIESEQCAKRTSADIYSALHNKEVTSTYKQYYSLCKDVIACTV